MKPPLSSREKKLARNGTDVNRYRHATRQANRKSIHVKGLLARSTAEHNYPDSDDFTQCVCVTPNEYGRPNVWEADNNALMDVWEVDVAGLPCEEDPNMDDYSIRILCDVPPERLQLVTTLRQRELVERWASRAVNRRKNVAA